MRNCATAGTAEGVDRGRLREGRRHHLDANLTGLIVGVALVCLGTGSLKGFALTMIIGIFASMFTAITASRALAQLIYGYRRRSSAVAIWTWVRTNQ